MDESRGIPVTTSTARSFFHCAPSFQRVGSMLSVAFKMLSHNVVRAVVSFLGITSAFLLASIQIGLLIGWCLTTSAIVRHADADLWIMANQTSSFDYGTPIPEQRVYQARSVPGVAEAHRMLNGWIVWQCPDGKRMNLELVGVDESLVGGPWEMASGSASVMHKPRHIIVDEMYCDDLGVSEINQEVEILDQRMVVGALSRDVRTFTAAPFVFCSIETARRCALIYDHDEITFVVVRCDPDTPVETVQRRLQDSLPDVEVLTQRDFAVRTMKYWMLETGAGIGVIITALLGLLVGTLVTSQTLYAITNDNLDNYAMLLAIGFSRRQLQLIVVIQAVSLGMVGVVCGTLLFFGVAEVSASTRLPVSMVFPVYVALVLALLLSCIVATWWSLRTVWNLDPGEVFRT